MPRLQAVRRAHGFLHRRLQLPLPIPDFPVFCLDVHLPRCEIPRRLVELCRLRLERPLRPFQLRAAGLQRLHPPRGFVRLPFRRFLRLRAHDGAPLALLCELLGPVDLFVRRAARLLELTELVLPAGLPRRPIGGERLSRLQDLGLHRLQLRLPLL